MQDSPTRGEAVPEPRRRPRRRLLVAVLVALTVVAGFVAIGARVDRQTTPDVSVIPGADHFRLAVKATAQRRAQARPAPTPDDDDDLDAVALLALSTSLAVIVRMASRLPQGHPARRALADASAPLRGALYPDLVPA